MEILSGLHFFIMDQNIDIHSYDTYIVAFSGGKDSVACFLWLLDQGISQEQIEIHHHEIDGREGGRLRMDWPSTPPYCRKFAKVMGASIYFSWRQGGFEREMMRDNRPTAPVSFETPNEGLQTRGGKGKDNTRLKFPQVSANLAVRWCSAYLKIDVMTITVKNQERFRNARTLILTGERAQESTARAQYSCFEPDRTDARAGKLDRHIDHLRPIHSWKEEQVWEIMERHCINPHPSYRLGWGRLSCASCIFGSKNQWASFRKVDPSMMDIIADYEQQFGCTIDRKLTVHEKADQGKPYESIEANPDVLIEAMDPNWDGDIIVENWKLPAGAYGESNGPT